MPAPPSHRDTATLEALLYLPSPREWLCAIKECAARHQASRAWSRTRVAEAMLLRAAQVAVVVDDVSVALVVVIELRVVPASIAGLAAGVEIVSTGADLFA